MNHIKNSRLAQNERMMYETRLHWKIFFWPALILVLAGYLYSQGWDRLSFVTAMGGAVYLAAAAYMYFTNEFVVATNNLYLREGLFPKTNRIPLSKITRVEVQARYNPLDVLLDSGGLLCVTDTGEKIEFKNIASPGEFDNHLNLQLNSPQKEPRDVTLGEGSVLPVVATPVLPSELERVRGEFKFYSPAQKPVRKAPPPKKGETWRLERTLPSGLVLLFLGNMTLGDEIKEMARSLFGGDINKRVDERPYLYDVERFLSEDPRRDTQSRETYSLAWHPTKMLLATSGVGNMPRVWDVTTGQTLTKRIFWHTASSGEMLCWSPDGELFISGENVCDGNTGESVCASNAPWSSHYRYSVNGYNRLRGHTLGFKGAAHLSADNNFSPWRPNSSQMMFGEDERNIVIREGRTGRVEKEIDCGVPSKVVDFAWHPKGRFIAVTFENHNIRVVDVDDAKIVDDLSVQNIVGWSPDGKALVARRENHKDDFVVWDALETAERPMPEGMRGELWFKRFFKIISVDGQRYIQADYDKGLGRSTTNVYSVESDELIATLPGDITSAAWSTTDGGLLTTCEGSETQIWRL